MKAADRARRKLEEAERELEMRAAGVYDGGVGGFAAEESPGSGSPSVVYRASGSVSGRQQQQQQQPSIFNFPGDAGDDIQGAAGGSDDGRGMSSTYEGGYQYTRIFRFCRSAWFRK
jgi:hypothetical protein